MGFEPTTFSLGSYADRRMFNYLAPNIRNFRVNDFKGLGALSQQPALG